MIYDGGTIVFKMTDQPCLFYCDPYISLENINIFSVFL